MKIILLLPLLALLLSGCQKGPDSKEITHYLQTQIDAAMGSDVLKITSLNARGGQSYTPMDSEHVGYIVYFTATLAFNGEYDRNLWNNRNSTDLHAMLGTTSTGIAGLTTDDRLPHQELTANGLAAFIEQEEHWVPSPLWTPSTSATDKTVSNTGLSKTQVECTPSST